MKCHCAKKIQILNIFKIKCLKLINALRMIPEDVFVVASQQARSAFPSNNIVYCCGLRINITRSLLLNAVLKGSTPLAWTHGFSHLALLFELYFRFRLSSISSTYTIRRFLCPCSYRPLSCIRGNEQTLIRHNITSANYC